MVTAYTVFSFVNEIEKSLKQTFSDVTLTATTLKLCKPSKLENGYIKM